MMAALPNIDGALCSTPQSLADAHSVPRSSSNAANIGERKTDACKVNFVLGKIPLRGNKYSVPAQKTAKHRAKFGWLPLSDVAEVTKPRRETR